MPVTTGAGVTYGAGVTVGPPPPPPGPQPVLVYDAATFTGPVDTPFTTFYYWNPTTGSPQMAVFGDGGFMYKNVGGIRYFDTVSNVNVTGRLQILDNPPANGAPQFLSTGYTMITWAQLKSTNFTRGRRLWGATPYGQEALYITANTNNLNDGSTNPSVASYVDVWAQWAVVGDSTGCTYYINGSQIGAFFAGGPPLGPASSTIVGNYLDNLNISYGTVSTAFGYVANLYVWQSKLTQSQIAQKYNELRGNFGV